MKLKIEYSVRGEIKRVRSAIKEVAWYNKNGYKITLPRGLRQENLGGRKLSKEQIDIFVAAEFKDGGYRRIGANVVKQWLSVNGKIKQRLQKLGLRVQPEYILILTKYGVGGSYNEPNYIVVNVHGKSAKSIIATVVHEVIHLAIEKFIKKYKIKHWYKERIVDLIASYTRLSSGQMQKAPLTTAVERIDCVFAKYYPDVKKIIRNV